MKQEVRAKGNEYSKVNTKAQLSQEEQQRLYFERKYGTKQKNNQNQAKTYDYDDMPLPSSNEPTSYTPPESLQAQGMPHEQAVQRGMIHDQEAYAHSQGERNKLYTAQMIGGSAMRADLSQPNPHFYPNQQEWAQTQNMNNGQEGPAYNTRYRNTNSGQQKILDDESLEPPINQEMKGSSQPDSDPYARKVQKFPLTAEQYQQQEQLRLMMQNQQKQLISNAALNDQRVENENQGYQLYESPSSSYTVGLQQYQKPLSQQAYPQTITFRFYCNHDKLYKYENVYLEFAFEKSQNHKLQVYDQVQMKKIEASPNTVYVEIQVPDTLWNGHWLNYQYLVNGTTLNYRTPVVNRVYKNFSKQRIFYDTPQVFNGVMNLQSIPNLSNYYTLFLRCNLEEIELYKQIHGNVVNFEQYFQFLKIHGYNQSFGDLIKELKVILAERKYTYSFTAYVYQIFGIISYQIERKNPIQSEYLNITRLILEGPPIYLKQIQSVWLDKHVSDLYQKETQYLIKGIRTLSDFNHNLGLMFITSDKIIVNRKEYLGLFQVLDNDQDQNHLLKVVEFFIDYYPEEFKGFKRNLSILVFDHAKTISRYLAINQKVYQYAGKDVVEQNAMRLRKNTDSRKLQEWILQNLSEIMNFESLVRVLYKDIQKCIKDNSTNMLFVQSNSNLFAKHPDLLEMSSIIDFAQGAVRADQIKSAQEMIIANLKGQGMMSFVEFQKIMLILFRNRIHSVKLIQILAQSYSDQIIQQGIIYSKCPNILELFETQQVIELYQRALLAKLQQEFNNKQVIEQLPQCLEFFAIQNLQADITDSFIGILVEFLQEKMNSKPQFYSILKCLKFNHQRSRVNQFSIQIWNLIMNYAEDCFSECTLLEYISDESFKSIVLDNIITYKELNFHYFTVRFNEFYQQIAQGDIQLEIVSRLVKEEHKVLNFFSEALFRTNIFEREQLTEIFTFIKTFRDQQEKAETFVKIFTNFQMIAFEGVDVFLKNLRQHRNTLKLSAIINDNSFKAFEKLKMPQIHSKLKESSIYSDFMQQFLEKVIQQFQQLGQLYPLQTIDQHMANEIIQKDLRNHILKLMEYPRQELQFSELNHWIGMTIDAVSRELQIFQNSEDIFEQQIRFHGDLQSDLQFYSKLQDLEKSCKSILKLSYLQNHSCISGNEENFDVIKNFIKMAEDPQSYSFNAVVQQIKLVHGMLQSKNGEIDIQSMSELQNAGDLIIFCLENIDTNFNDMNDQLDDDILEDRSVLNDMNSIKQFICQLQKVLKDRSIVTNFNSLLLTITKQLSLAIKSDRGFLGRLRICVTELENIRTICNTQLNTQENAINIVKQIMMEGQAILWIAGEKCNLKIGYGNAKEIDNEKINTYCSRAILTSHNRKDGDRNDNTLSTITDAFSVIVTLLQEIKKVLQDLSQNGHMDYNDQFIIRYTIPDISQERLEKDFEKYQNLANQWKSDLNLIRKAQYFMTYIPNSKFSMLANYFQHESQLSNQIYSIFQFINPAINPEQARRENRLKAGNSNKDMVLEFGKLIQRVFFGVPVNDVKMFYDSKLNEIKVNLLKVGNYKVYQVRNSLENIKAIASIFCISKSYPRMSQVMFCNSRTKLYEVECFILRAMLHNKNRKPTEEKVYVLSNFQKLSLSIQIDAVKFLEKITEEQNSLKFTEYNLIILQTVDPKNPEFLVEEMQQKPSFNPYFVDDASLRKFFAYGNVTLVTSDRAGLGKSAYIRKQIKGSGQTYINIPMQGDLSKDKIYMMHSKNLDMIDENQGIGFHYTINLSQGEDVNIVLFELLTFGGINNGDSFIYYIPNQNRTFYIELSQDIYKNHEDKLFLHLIKNQTNLSWDIRRLEVSQQPNSFAQYVLKTIQMRHTKSFNFEFLQDQNSIINNMEARKLLDQEFLQDVQDPNFYMLDSYFAFAGDQINQLMRSEFFNGITFQLQFENASAEYLNNFVMCILDFSKKICKMTKSMANQQLSIGQNRIGELEEVKGMEDVAWSFQKEAFITFNDDGTVTPVFRNFEQLPSFIQRYYKENLGVFLQAKQADKVKEIKLEMESFESISKIAPDKIIEKIFKICGRDYEEFKKLNKGSPYYFDHKRLAFTADNFLKMNFIFLRLRSRQLVTIMGETGVGKTALIEYLKDVMQWSYEKLNIHEGITEEKIVEFVQKANSKKFVRVILFFDEVNTNFNVSGLLKEIMIDRTLNGSPIGDHISIVAACNPYKLILTQNVRRTFTSGIKHNRINQLADNVVYKVHPLPESVFPFVQDYGALQLDEQQKYITKIIERIKEQVLVEYSPEIINFISKCVFASHEFIHERFSASSISLRDVDRFRKLYTYFFYHNKMRADCGDRDSYYHLPQVDVMRRVLVLSLTVAYKLSIGTKDLRLEYDRKILSIREGDICIRDTEIDRYVKEEQDRYLKNIEIPRGIGKNDSLKENVFAIITMIMNKIPLFITGKPGSSKTLAMNLVSKSMKGKGSQSEFFKRLPALQIFNFQCSIQSNSAGIESLFEKGNQASEKYLTKMKAKDGNQANISEVIFVVVIDEIGLAELSPHNPLKVLHSFLEEFKVGFVGISNWALDDSKRNRGINLSKPDPTYDDLRQSAESQFKEIFDIPDDPKAHKSKGDLQTFKVFTDQYLDKLVNFYSKYYESQSIPNFHGLRDFYQLICFIGNQMKKNRDGHEAIFEGVQRNFGGQNIDKVLQSLVSEFDNLNIDDFDKMQPDLLISENLNDELARNLMIISDHQETMTLRYIEAICTSQNKLYQIFYGSSFEKDKKEEAIYQIINDIILCMESGKIVILLNLDNIYQAFYDMLNQNYQIVGGQRRCKVTIGHDSSRCVVHQDFKCILLVNSKQVKMMDAPLLNRFEKHRYNDYENLKDQDKDLIEELIRWMNSVSQCRTRQGKFQAEDMFPVLAQNEDQLKNSLTTLVLMAKTLDFSEEDYDDLIRDFCKKQILSLANYSGVLRSVTTISPDQDTLIQYYKDAECHTDVINMIANYEELWFQDYFFNKNPAVNDYSNCGFNVCAYTYSSSTLGNEGLAEDLLIEKKPVMIDGILSKNELEVELKRFFSLRNESASLLIIADSLKNDSNTLSLIRSLINQARNKYKLDCIQEKNENEDFEIKFKNVVFIIRVYGNYNANICFGLGWKETFVDLANGRQNTKINVEKLLNFNFNQIVKDDTIFTYILDLSIPHIVSLIKYPSSVQQNGKNEESNNLDKQKFTASRVNILTNILLESQDVTEMIKGLFKELIQKNDDVNLLNVEWKLKAVCNREIMNQSLSFHQAAIIFIRQLMIRNIGFIVFQLEDMSLVDILHECCKRQERNQIQTLIEHFIEIFHTTFIAQPLKANYILKDNQGRAEYPFYKYIQEKMEAIRDIAINETNRIDQSLNHELLKIEESLDFIVQMEKKIKKNAEADDPEFTEDEIQQKKEQIIQRREEISQDLNAIIDSQVRRYNEIIQQILQNFTKEDIEKGILRFNQNAYLCSLSSQLGKDVDYDYYHRILQLLIPPVQNIDCAQTYAAYLLYHNFIESALICLTQLRDFVKIDDFFELFKNRYEEVSNSEFMKIEDFKRERSALEEDEGGERAGEDRLGMKPKYMLKTAFIRSIYELLLPSEKLVDQLDHRGLSYEELIHQVLANLEPFICFQQIKEISMIQFLLRYKQKVINNLHEKNINELRDLAEKIRDTDNPIAKIEIVIDINDPDKDQQSDNEDREDEKEDEQQEEEQQNVYDENQEQQPEEDKEAESSDNENEDEESSDDGGREESKEEKQLRIVWEFIYSYLEDEFDKVLESDMDEYLDFCLKALSTNFQLLKKNPLLAHGIVRKIIIQAQRKQSQVFIQQAGLNYQELRQNNSFVQRFDEFFEELKIDSPFTIIVCDIIGEVIQEEIENIESTQRSNQEEQEMINTKCQILRNQMEESLNSVNPLFQRVIGVAYCRVILNEITDRMILSFNQGQGVPEHELIQTINEYFSNEQIDKVKPYIFYLFKVLSQHMDYDSLMQRLMPRFNWIIAIKTKENTNRRIFKVFATKKIEHQTQIILQLTNQNSFQANVNQALQKYKLRLLTLQVVAQEFYYNGQSDRIDTLRFMQQLTFNDPRATTFYDILCQGPDNYSQLRSRVLRGAHQGMIGELVVYSIANFLTLPNTNIFKHILDQPLGLAQMYLPFVVNTRYDLQYFYYFRVNEPFARYACVACGEYFLVGDCGALSNHRSNNQQVNLGGTLCKCGQRVGFGAENNSRPIDRSKRQNNFNPENESQMGYICQDAEVYDSVTVRGLNNIARCIGQIVMHLMILGAHLFSDDNIQHQMQAVYASDYPNNANQSRVEYCQAFIVKIIRHNCESLKQLLGINDDRIKLLIEHIIQDIATKCQAAEFNNFLSVANLATIQGRRDLELHFQQHCIPRFEDNFVEFFRNNNELNVNDNPEFRKNQELIDETSDLSDYSKEEKDANMFHLLRAQGQITLQKFEQFLNSNQSIEGDFLLRIITQIQNLEIISNLRELMDWMKYVLMKFDGKISYEDSMNLNIRTIFDRTFTNQKERNATYEKFEKFAVAWNTVMDFADIRDGCDPIEVPRMSLDSRFALICITNEKKDQLGIYYYYLINYLSNLQNGFLDGISRLKGYEFLQQQLERPVKFKDLKPYQIICEEVTEENIVKEIKQCSINKLHFGQGRNVEYNIKKLSEQLANRLLKNKVAIQSKEEEAPIQFTFENLTNPYNQFVEIADSIAQIKYPSQYQVIERLRSFEDRYNLLKDLQVTLNFIQQTKGSHTQSLKLYMKSFKIQSHEEIDEGIELQHVLDLYERVEDTLQNRLVQSANPMYQEELREIDEGILTDVVDTCQEKLPALLPDSKTILGRFIIRQLCYSSQIPAPGALFPYLFDDFNEYLFGIGVGLGRKEGQKPLPCEDYIKAFRRTSVAISHSYNTYHLFNKLLKDKELEDEERKKQKESQQRKNAMKLRALQDANANGNEADERGLADMIKAGPPMSTEEFFGDFDNSNEEEEKKKKKDKPVKAMDKKSAKVSKFSGLAGLKKPKK